MARATAQAAELDPAELRAGGERLATLVAERRPRILAIAGVTAYRTAFARPGAAIGPQPAQPGASHLPPPPHGPQLWILPNPSGLNAHWTLDAIAAEFAALRAAATLQSHPDQPPLPHP